MAHTRNQLATAPVYEIKIPRGLPELDGTLTRKERVEIALDVIAVLRSRQRKIQLESVYFDGVVPGRGQLHSSRIDGGCSVCARGMLFLKSIDRFNHFDLWKERGIVTSDDVRSRTADEWGDSQALDIEAAFECSASYGGSRAAAYFGENIDDNGNRKEVLLAICQNIVDNHGEFRPS